MAAGATAETVQPAALNGSPEPITPAEEAGETMTRIEN